LKLRPYQDDLVNKIRDSIKSGSKSICAVLGCGGGKSVIQGKISSSATLKGNRVLFLVHRKELCEQIEGTFAICGVNFELCDISMVQTVSRRLDKIEKPDIIITDECHHSLAKTYIKIYEKFPEALRLGFTATPVRDKEGGLGTIYETMITGVKTEWLISNSFLSPYKYYSIKLAETKGLKTKMGDFDKKQVALLMEKSQIFGDTVDNWLKISPNTKTIVYCSTVEASKKTAEAFNKANISAAHLDGETPKAKRKNTIDDFRQGKIDVLVNVDLFGEGFDVPDCETVVLLRPTKSLTIHIQQSMRSMRYKEGKTAVIIDHVGNVYRHGFPDDEREWSLKSKKATRKENEIKIRDCIKCFTTFSFNHRVCPFCGYEILNESRYEKEMIDYELEELDRKGMLSKQNYAFYEKLKTFEQVKKFQKSKGYKFSWCLHKCKELRISIPNKYDYRLENFM